MEEDSENFDDIILDYLDMITEKHLRMNSPMRFYVYLQRDDFIINTEEYTEEEYNFEKEQSILVTGRCPEEAYLKIYEKYGFESVIDLRDRDITFFRDEDGEINVSKYVEELKKDIKYGYRDMITHDHIITKGGLEGNQIIELIFDQSELYEKQLKRQANRIGAEIASLQAGKNKKLPKGGVDYQEFEKHIRENYSNN